MDSFKNFAKVTVSTGYDAAATSIVLSGGHGARLPTAPFNATWYNSTDFADPSDDPNVEIVRVTAKATDTLTVTRAQESTGASTKNTASKTYKLIAGLTAKTLNTDISSGAIVLNGRLTLESLTPVTTDSSVTRDAGMGQLLDVVTPQADQIAKGTIYFTPYQGNRISVYSGTAWQLYTFSELSLTLTGVTADKNYDIFIHDNAGTLTLSLSTAWASATARTDALAVQDGVYVKGGSPTHRYLGTFRSSGANITEDSIVKRFLWNYQNRVFRSVFKGVPPATPHTYDGQYRVWNDDPTMSVAFVAGIAEDAISCSIFCQLNATPTTYALIAVGLDISTAVLADSNIVYHGSHGGFGLTVDVPPQLGFHTLYLCETTLAMGVCQFDVGAIRARLTA